jgi:hypothetical protein
MNEKFKKPKVFKQNELAGSDRAKSSFDISYTQNLEKIRVMSDGVIQTRGANGFLPLSLLIPCLKYSSLTELVCKLLFPEMWFGLFGLEGFRWL